MNDMDELIFELTRLDMEASRGAAGPDWVYEIAPDKDGEFMVRSRGGWVPGPGARWWILAIRNAQVLNTPNAAGIPWSLS